MKIILSRKGFDSKFGKQPSLIMPDGTLLSFPIPMEGDIKKFTDLNFNGKSYYEIIKELKPNCKITESCTCHLDPDLIKFIITRDKNWLPIFGQADAAQGYLKNNDVDTGDIFLFFGWFKEVELINNKYQYKKNAPDLHVIFGYLQIGKKYLYPQQKNELPKYVKYHPHVQEAFNKKYKDNCIYVAKDKLSLNPKYSGAGNLKFNENLVLTKKEMSRSKWGLPDFFNELSISYHTKESFKDGYFQSVPIGQEFVIKANDELIKWVKERIEQ